MGVYCHRCGTQLPVSARFCSACGAGIPTEQAVQGRPLVRPIYGRKIAGVCIAMSQAYGWDVALVRIFTVVGFFCSGGIVAVAYIAGWIGIPEETIAPGVYPPGI
ncbi:MAG: PspC domain-containing protein [Terracidiphilus sp.]|jgi:phage shock protein PspC (stress-responsive transcriptional regulator)